MRKRIIGCGVLVGLMIWGLTTQTKLLIGVTPSLPQKVFLMVPWVKPQKGDLVGLQGHATSYLPATTLYVKRLVGQPGDVISRAGNCILVNGQPIGSAKNQTEKGDPLTPMAPHIIPEGFVFVAATHPRSFDSRYQEFGLVKQDFLLGQAWGLL